MSEIDLRKVIKDVDSCIEGFGKLGDPFYHGFEIVLDGNFNDEDHLGNIDYNNSKIILNRTLLGKQGEFLKEYTASIYGFYYPIAVAYRLLSEMSGENESLIENSRSIYGIGKKVEFDVEHLLSTGTGRNGYRFRVNRSDGENIQSELIDSYLASPVDGEKVTFNDADITDICELQDKTRERILGYNEGFYILGKLEERARQANQADQVYLAVLRAAINKSLGSGNSFDSSFKKLLGESIDQIYVLAEFDIRYRTKTMDEERISTQEDIVKRMIGDQRPGRDLKRILNVLGTYVNKSGYQVIVDKKNETFETILPNLGSDPVDDMTHKEILNFFDFVNMKLTELADRRDNLKKKTVAN